MKTKYLFGMLLSGAVLAACSTEDDLNLSKKQEVNPSAPVFTVSFEDDDALGTRASMDDKAVLTFDGTEKMSLFHGMPEVATSGWQNAVYSVSTTDGAGVFTTPAVVNKGLAVMIYPADTDFNNTVNTATNIGEAAPAIIIPAVQDENTKNKTPFMSAYVNIQDGKNDTGVAGYEKEYDIALKRVGSTLFLALDVKDSEKLNTAIESEGVEPIEITKVELDAGTADAFTTAISVEPAEGSYDAHKTWAKKSTVNTTTAPATGLADDIDAQSQTLTTSDLGENKDKATFTLLPVIAANGKVTATSSAQIVVYTTYGTVTLAADDEVWYKGNVKDNVQNGLSSILDNANIYKVPSSSKNFPGEEAGVYMNRTIAVDMSGLKMDGLHVQSGKQLVDALKVFNAFSSEESATFYLDGVDEGTFTMTAAQLAEVQDLNAEGKVTLTPCDKETECSTVQITGGNNTEIPDLKFGGDGVVVELSGNWKYTTVVDEDTQKEFENVTEIKILDGTLGLDNTIGTTNDELKITIANGAVAEVLGTDVILDVDMDNYGTINIGENQKLRLDNDHTLTNFESQADKATGRTTDAVGVINMGKGATLGAVENTGAQSTINNYGLINTTNGDAYIFITTNALDGSDLGEVFAKGSNAIGTIDLGESIGDSKKLTIAKALSAGSMDRTKIEYGFVKTTMKTAHDTKYEAYGNVANYFILKEGSNVTYNSANESSGKTSIPKEVVFIEIAGTTQVEFIGAFKLNGLIIPGALNNAFVGNGSSITVSGDVYLKGGIINGGTLNMADMYNGYFGGDEDDWKRITTQAGGSTN